MASVQFLTTIASVFFFFLILHGGYAIRCFQCNSHVDERCDEKIPPSHKVVECSSLKDGGKNYTFCRKITQVIEFSVNDLKPDSRIIRGCGWDNSNYQNTCYARAGFGGRQEVCACDKDECNSAYTIKKPMNLILVSFIVLLSATIIRV